LSVPEEVIKEACESFKCLIEVMGSFGGTETIEYRLFKNYALGAGFARQLTDLSVNDNDWAGLIT